LKNVAIVIAIGVLVALLEMPNLLKKKMFKEGVVFLTLLFLATLVASLKALNAPLPNPFDWIEAVYKPVIERIWAILS